MKNKKYIFVGELKNGYNVSLPGILGNHWSGTRVFYTECLNDSSLNKTKFAVVESPAARVKDDLITYTGPYKRIVGTPDTPNLLDVCYTKEEAKQICKKIAFEIVNKEAKKKYEIIQGLQKDLDKQFKRDHSLEWLIAGVGTSIIFAGVLGGLSYIIPKLNHFRDMQIEKAKRNCLMKTVYQTEKNGLHYDLNANLPADTARFEDYCNKK